MARTRQTAQCARGPVVALPPGSMPPERLSDRPLRNGSWQATSRRKRPVHRRRLPPTQDQTPPPIASATPAHLPARAWPLGIRWRRRGAAPPLRDRRPALGAPPPPLSDRRVCRRTLGRIRPDQSTMPPRRDGSSRRASRVAAPSPSIGLPHASADRTRRPTSPGRGPAPGHERRRRVRARQGQRCSGRLRADPRSSVRTGRPLASSSRIVSSVPLSPVAIHPRRLRSAIKASVRIPAALRSTRSENDSAATPRSPQYRSTIAAAAPPQSNSVCEMKGTSRRESAAGLSRCA